MHFTIDNDNRKDYMRAACHAFLRSLSILALITFFSLCSASSVYAGATFSGDGTEKSPYGIADAGQLAELAALVNSNNVNYNDKHYILTENIDLSKFGNWTPIGKSSGNTFKGTFNGNNKKITGMTITDTTIDTQGLFGYIWGATIEKLGVESVSITAASGVGGIAGSANGASNIKNSYVTGSIAGNGMVGGIVGPIPNGRVENCYSTATVTGGTSICFGGIAGDSAYATLQNCYSTGAISGDNHVGGIAGRINKFTTIENCVALNPSVTATTDSDEVYLGHLVTYTTCGTITNNYYLSAMSAISKVPSASVITIGGKVGAGEIGEDFWRNKAKWSESVWSIGDDGLPQLRDFEKAPSAAKEITEFLLAGSAGKIDDAEGTITLTVSFGTVITNIAPAITHTGASIEPAAGEPRNFTSPVTYRVTAADDSKKEYVVTVTIAPSAAKEITEFLLAGSAGKIDDAEGTITVTVPFGTVITNIAPAITHTGTSIEPAAGEARNFTGPVTYRVTAADGSAKQYVVTVGAGAESADGGCNAGGMGAAGMWITILAFFRLCSKPRKKR